MPNTKVRKKSLLESYLETVPLGSTLEAFCDKTNRKTESFENSHDTFSCSQSPFGLLHFEHTAQDFPFVDAPDALQDYGGQSDQNKSSSNSDNGSNTDCLSSVDDGSDEGYNSSQLPQELTLCVDSSNSDEDSEKGREMPSRDLHDGVRKSSSLSKSIGKKMHVASTCSSQVKEIVRKLSGIQRPEDKRPCLGNDTHCSKTNLNRSEASCDKYGKEVIGTETVQYHTDTDCSSNELCFKFSCNNKRCVNGHFEDSAPVSTHHGLLKGEKVTIPTSNSIKTSTVSLKPLKSLNYTTAKSFTFDKAIRVGSAGLTSLEPKLSQDAFVSASKDPVRRRPSPVVQPTMISGQLVVLSNSQALKRDIKPEDDKPVECKQNTQDVKEIYKNLKTISDLPADIGLDETGKNPNDVDSSVNGTTNGIASSEIVESSTPPLRSSYYFTCSNPVLNHDKVSVESGDKENIKECVVGRKLPIGVVATTAQSNCCCAMERRVSFNLGPVHSSTSDCNEGKVKGAKDIEDNEDDEVLPVSCTAEETDSNAHGLSKKPFKLAFPRERLSILKKTKSLDVREKTSCSFDTEDTNFTCDDSSVDYRDFEAPEDELAQSIDEELQKYINYKFPGVEALSNSTDDQDQTDSAIPDLTGHSLQQFIQKQENMENVRLQKVLLEVEQARSGTVKALLQVNAVLNRVQGENMKLEGDLKSMVQEKEYLRETLAELKKKSEFDDGTAFSAFRELCTDAKGQEEYVIDRQRREELESNMKIFLQSTKREKRDLLQALAKSTNRAEIAQRDAEKLRIQFKKVKEQLETSNNTFSKILKHNLKATQKLEEELQSALNEKKMLLESLQKGTAHSKDLEGLRNQLQECQTNLQDTLMERDQLDKKIAHLEKQKRDLKNECEELQEQIDHSQEVMDKLTESNDELKERLDKALGEKDYLQSCLDETGNLLVHLRNNEKKLQEEKGNLEEDLESEMQQKESLRESLRRTTHEHKSLVDQLQEMNSTNDTVQETLKEASQKEEYYKNQIEELNKNNHLMHYMLEKEKEEHHDLKEMYDSLDSNFKKLRRETTEELMLLRQSVEQLTESSKQLTEQKEELTKTSTDLRNNLEQEEEENIALRKTLAWNEQHKEKLENEAKFLRESKEEAEKELAEVKKKIDELQKLLRRESEKSDSLSTSVGSREELLTKVSADLSTSRSVVHEKDKLIGDLTKKIKDKDDIIADLTKKIDMLQREREDQKERYAETEKECKMSQKACLKYKGELEKLEDEHAKLEQERNMLRHSLVDGANEFEVHQAKCTETARHLREQIASLHTQLIEKDRIALKQKEHYQDAIDNTNSDLALLRHFMDNEVYVSSPPAEPRSRGSPQGNVFDTDSMDADTEAIDVDFLRNVHQQFENEMQSHVNNLEGILHVSRQTNDSVTVVQSPMSKIKLEEIKTLRDETFELRSEVKNMSGLLNNLVDQISKLKSDVGIEGGDDLLDRRKKISERTPDIEEELQRLLQSISKIEARHVSIVRRNSSLLDHARKRVPIVKKRETEKGIEFSDEENNEKFDREIMVFTLKEENLKLKAFLSFLNKRLNLRDNQFLRTLVQPEAGGSKRGRESRSSDGAFSPIDFSDSSDRLVPPVRRSQIKSRSALSSPSVERAYLGSSYSGSSSPITQSRFRPISPAISRYQSSEDVDSSSSRYGRSASEHLASTATRIYSQSRSSDSDQTGIHRGYYDYPEDPQRVRKLSRNSDGDAITSPPTRRRELDTNNNNHSRRKSADWDQDSRSSSRKGYSLVDSESSMFQYQDTQGSRILRRKMNERHKGSDGSGSDVQFSGRSDTRGLGYASSSDSMRSKTLPRTRSKYP